MSIQLCVLETGETVIGDVREAIDPESNESLGYLVSNPYVVEHTFVNTVNVDENFQDAETSPEGASTISFHYWAPLARERQYSFHKDFVRVIYEPAYELTEQYSQILLKWQEENTKTVVADKHQTNVSWAGDQLLQDQLGAVPTDNFTPPSGDSE